MQSEPLAPPDPAQVRADVERALAEDLGSGDVTADLLPANARADATVVCRQAATIAGQAWFERCFHALDPEVDIAWAVAEGQRVPAGALLCRLRGRVRALVSAERTALNFLQTLSATASVARAYADAVSGTAARILDTRKTLPGLRHAQKYAVRAGGAHNHRMGLYDAVMLKENHISAAGSIAAAAAAARRLHPSVPLIIEVESLGELQQALGVAPERVLLDDFTLEQMVEAVRRRDRAASAGTPRVPLEVSGSVDLARVRGIADTGVDFISVGALTKHVQAIDLSLRLA